MLELWYFTRVFLVTDQQEFWPCDFNIGVLLFECLNLFHNIWILNAKALIFHTNIPCNKIFPYWYMIFWPWHLTNFWKKLTLVIPSKKNDMRAFILHMVISLFLVARSFYLYQNIVLGILAIFGIGHYRGHLCFTMHYYKMYRCT